MKKFKEYLGEAFFKVKIPDVAPTFVEADSASQVKQNMRKIMKPDVIKELEIERVTPAKMKQMYRDMAKGKDEVEEGVLDLLTKKGREKQAKVSRRLAGVRKVQKGREDEIRRMDRLQTKGAGQHTLSPDEKSELSRLRSKYRDVVKKREDKSRKSMPKG
jgi:hypothetical protein